MYLYIFSCEAFTLNASYFQFLLRWWDPTWIWPCGSWRVAGFYLPRNHDSNARRNILLGGQVLFRDPQQTAGVLGYIMVYHLPKKTTKKSRHHQVCPILSQRLPKFVHFPDRVEFVLADILILNPQREESSALRKDLCPFRAKFLEFFNLFPLVQMVKKNWAMPNAFHLEKSSAIPWNSNPGANKVQKLVQLQEIPNWNPPCNREHRAEENPSLQFAPKKVEKKPFGEALSHHVPPYQRFCSSDPTCSGFLVHPGRDFRPLTWFRMLQIPPS